MACASVVSPIEIFAVDEAGRRRHWSDADKIQIVEESLRGYRQGSIATRRYGISRSLLSIWRREYHSGTLVAPGAGGGFVPLVMESPLPRPEEGTSWGANDARIDITLTNGRRMTSPASLASSHLAALPAVLDSR